MEASINVLKLELKSFLRFVLDKNSSIDNIINL